MTHDASLSEVETCSTMRCHSGTSCCYAVRFIELEHERDSLLGFGFKSSTILSLTMIVFLLSKSWLGHFTTFVKYQHWLSMEKLEDRFKRLAASLCRDLLPVLVVCLFNSTDTFKNALTLCLQDLRQMVCESVAQFDVKPTHLWISVFTKTKSSISCVHVCTLTMVLALWCHLYVCREILVL